MSSCEENKKPEEIEEILIKIRTSLDFGRGYVGEYKRLEFTAYNKEGKKLSDVRIHGHGDIREKREHKFLGAELCSELSKFLVNKGYCRTNLREGVIKIEKNLVGLESLDNSIVFDERQLPTKPLRDVYRQVGDTTYLFLGRNIHLFFTYEGQGPREIYVNRDPVGGCTLDFDIEYLKKCEKDISSLREDLAKDTREFIERNLEDYGKLKSGLEKLFAEDETK